MKINRISVYRTALPYVGGEYRWDAGLRDYLVEHGISVVAEDNWGGEITTAALAHLAGSGKRQVGSFVLDGVLQ